MTSSGPEVGELCARSGLFLDPWQQMCLDDGLGEQADGQWAAFECGAVVNRQNGKGEILMALSIGGLFVLEEELILHTAHLFATSSEAFLRICTLIENSDTLRKKCKKPRRTTGQEAIETLQGQRLRFIARSQGSGRGFTGDRVILDEAQILSDASMRAILPTMSAVPNPQVWYTGTSGTPQSSQLGAVRRRGIAGDNASLFYAEWSIDDVAYKAATPVEQETMRSDRELWAVANPALGIRITEDYVEREQAALSKEAFAAERLGVGDWPDDDNEADIPMDAWHALADPRGGRA